MKDHLLPAPRTLGAGPGRWPKPQRPTLRVVIWTAATVVLAVVAALLWRGSDAAATSSTTAGPAGAVPGSPAATLSQAWSVAGGPVPGTVVLRNRVVVGSAHGLAALDPRTGREAWHYTRSNARLCGVTAVDGVAVAVFEVPAERHRCDQMVALSVDTGRRTWTRNINLRPDATLTSTSRTVLAVDPTGIVAVDPVGDNIRWRIHAQDACRLSAVAGDTGIAVVQQCASGATQLRSIDAYGGGPRWSRDLPPGVAVHLVGADGMVSAVVGDSLALFAAQDGTPLPAVPLPVGGDGVGETALDGSVLVWARDTLFSLDPAGGAVRWQVAARGLPGGAGSSPLPVPQENGFALLDAATGAQAQRSAAPGVPAGGVATRVGAVIVYRLPDRVIGYR